MQDSTPKVQPALMAERVLMKGYGGSDMLKHYVTFSEVNRAYMDANSLSDLCDKYSLSGAEVFMDDVVNRFKPVFLTKEDVDALVIELNKYKVKRLHCTYWAYPSSFLTGNNYSELVDHFGSEEAVSDYFGDITGAHMFNRWTQEYILASKLNAHSYVFHLIDFAPIDGMWEFTITKNDIRQAMISILQRFVNLLLQKNLISSESPTIEIENAGWGLEHGIQSAEDYAMLYDQLFDPYNKVKISWDVNHLLHALGLDRATGRARFFLPDSEITPSMMALQSQYGDFPEKLCQKWIEYNILFPKLRDRIGAIHISDCALKEDEHFTNGVLTGEAYEHICSLATWKERESYGVNIVLSEYDSHLVLGTGILQPQMIQEMILELHRSNSDFVLLHELKNSSNIQADLHAQMLALNL